MQRNHYNQDQSQQTNSLLQNQELPKIPGPTNFSGPILATMVSVGTIGGILLSYYLSITNEQIEQFPKASLTQAILNYPSFFIFRMLEIPAAILLFLVYSMAIWWQESKAQTIGVELTNQSSIFSSFILSLVALLIALASIDMDEMNYSIYAYSTCFAYGFTLNNFIMLNINIIKLRNANPVIISDNSYYTKLTVVFALVLLTIYAFFKGYVWDIFQQTGGEDFNAFGYVYTLIYCIYFVTWIFDWKYYILQFNLDITQPNSIKQQQQQQQQNNQSSNSLLRFTQYQEIELNNQ